MLTCYSNSYKDRKKKVSTGLECLKQLKRAVTLGPRNVGAFSAGSATSACGCSFPCCLLLAQGQAWSCSGICSVVFFFFPQK